MTRKGVIVTATSVAVAEARNGETAVVEKPPQFARVSIVPAPAVTAPIACRILHPSGWVVKCGTFPPASWLATVLTAQRP